MKKILAFILAIIMISCCLFSCDMDSSDKTNDKNNDKSTEKEIDNSSSWWDKWMDMETGNGNNVNGGNYGGYYGGSESGTGGNYGGGVTERPTNEYGEETFESVVLPTIDFGGDTITVLHRSQTRVQREWYKETAEDEVDEVIAVRNESVSNYLNLNIAYIPMAESSYGDCLSAFSTAIQNDVIEGLHNIDIVANYAYAGAHASIRDCLANIADKEVFPYFDFSLPCWNQSIVNTTLINDKLYYITGDLNLSTFDKTMVIFLNKSVYNQKRTADDPTDLQDLALEGYDFTANYGKGAGKAGGFTYDDLYSWATRDNSVAELNGINGYQHDDFHAISAGYGSVPLDALPYAWDLDYLVTNAYGSHSYDIVGNNKIETAITKAQDLLDGTKAKGVCNSDDADNCGLGIGISEPLIHFATGKSIFAIHVLYASIEDNVMIRNMEDEMGLLPIPKYDEDQIDYGTTAHDSYTLMTVLDHTYSDVPTKGEAVSAYLQKSTEESYTNLRGYYINNIVKPKYFGSDETNGSVTKSIQIFNIIASNIEFPFISIYAPQLNGVLNTCWRNAVTDGMTAKEAYEANQTTFDDALAAVDSWLDLV